MAGCVAQADGSEIVRRQPAVDIVIGTQSYHRLPEAITRAHTEPVIAIDEFAGVEKFDRISPPTDHKTRSRGVTAFVSVQEGCDKFCAFCVVPFTRGVEISRSVGKISEEIDRLVESGVHEVTLLGQNVNAYHGSGPGEREVSLAELIEIIAKKSRIERIRYTTSHPLDMRQDLINAHRNIDKLMPYVHLPVQSGSDRILSAMNRKHSGAEYLRIIERIRVARPDVAISSDFIVGFPGETRAEFEQTLALVRSVEFASAYSFKYSPRPGTRASSLDAQVDEAEKSDRLLELQELLDHQRRAFNERLIGRHTKVLFEKPGRHSGQFIGKSPYLQAVYVQSQKPVIGETLEVKIIGAGPNALQGEVIRSELS